jgi:hypothetical protein
MSGVVGPSSSGGRRLYWHNGDSQPALDQASSLSWAMGLTTILTTIWVCPSKSAKHIISEPTPRPELGQMGPKTHRNQGETMIKNRGQLSNFTGPVDIRIEAAFPHKGHSKAARGHPEAPWGARSSDTRHSAPCHGMTVSGNSRLGTSWVTNRLPNSATSAAVGWAGLDITIYLTGCRGPAADL